MKAIFIPSFTTAGQKYIVALDTKTGEPRCECPAFRKARPCKHVRLFETVRYALRTCTEAHFTDPDVLCPTCLATLLVAFIKKHAPKKEKKR